MYKNSNNSNSDEDGDNDGSDDVVNYKPPKKKTKKKIGEIIKCDAAGCDWSGNYKEFTNHLKKKNMEHCQEHRKLKCTCTEPGCERVLNHAKCKYQHIYYIVCIMYLYCSIV